MNRYRIELTCTHPEWWRYNVVMTAEGRDDRDGKCGYFSVEDRIAEPEKSLAAPPADYPADRRSVLECAPCAALQLYLYIIPHRLPDCSDIEETPAFPVCMEVFRNGKPLRTEQLEVNPWGGYSGYFAWKE